MLEGPGFSVNVGEEIARGIEVGLHEINQNQSRFFAVAEFLIVDACVVFVSVFAHWLGPITRGFSIRVMNLRSIQMKHLLSFECARQEEKTVRIRTLLYSGTDLGYGC